MMKLEIELENMSYPLYTFTENIYVREEDMDKIDDVSVLVNDHIDRMKFFIPFEVEAYVIREHAFPRTGTWCSVTHIKHGIPTMVFRRFFPVYEDGSISIKQYMEYIEFVHPIVHEFKCA